MIGKISVPRGTRVEPLIRYLFGPGRREEHTDPHIICGWRHPAALEPPLRDGRRDFRRLNGLLNQPHDALGDRGYARPVWHCALRAAPTDRMLSDDEWAQIACEVMDRTGLAPHGEEDDAVRWIAVRHGADHIHLVAMLARQDGGPKPRLSNERYKVRAACRSAERRYGLRSTAPADRTAPRRPTRAEHEKAARRGMGEPPRVMLRRQVITAAAASSNATGFFARLERAGVLVRIRYSTRDPGQVTGYAVALPGDTAKDGGRVWYGGGKLAADLTWPRLSKRWTRSAGPGPRREPLTAEDRNAIYQDAARAAAEAAARLRACGRTDPAGAADIAWAAGDTLHAAAAAIGNAGLRRAADSFDRAARAAHGRVPRPGPAGSQLRHTARLLGALGYLTGSPKVTPVMLMVRLAALAEAVAELREVQQRAHQAAAARTAARHLYAAARTTSATRPPARPDARSAARVAAQSFPGPPIPSRNRQHATGETAPRPPRRPAQPRPRGPTR